MICAASGTANPDRTSFHPPGTMPSFASQARDTGITDSPSCSSKSPSFESSHRRPVPPHRSGASCVGDPVEQRSGRSLPGLVDPHSRSLLGSDACAEHPSGASISRMVGSQVTPWFEPVVFFAFVLEIEASSYFIYSFQATCIVSWVMFWYCTTYV